MQLSVNDVPSRMSSEKFWTITSQLRLCTSPIRVKRGTIASTVTTSQSAIRHGNDLIIFKDFLHASCREPLFTKLGLATVWPKVSTVKMSLAEIPTDIKVRKTALGKNDAMLYWPWSHCIFIAYDPPASVFKVTHSMALLFYLYCRGSPVLLWSSHHA